MNLSNLKKGEKGIIKGFYNQSLSLKLLELGVLPGIKFEIILVSIFQDPICISYGYSCLVLRKDEAEKILVEPL